MTFLQMINAVLKKMDEATIAGVASHTNISGKVADWINFRFQEILSRYRWSFLYKSSTFATAASDYDYSLAATDIRNIDRIWYQSNVTPKHLTPISLDDWMERYPDPVNFGSKGKPLVWCEGPLDNTGKNQVYLYPVPDAIYTLSYGYFKVVSDMSADADVPGVAAGAGARIWPVLYDDVIVQGAMIDALNYNEDTQALQQEVRWERMIYNMNIQTGTSRKRRKLQGDAGRDIAHFPDLPGEFSGYWR